MGYIEDLNSTRSTLFKALVEMYLIIILGSFRKFEFNLNEMPNQTSSTYKRLHSDSGRVQLCCPASCCTFREGSRLGRSLCSTTVKKRKAYLQKNCK